MVSTRSLVAFGIAMGQKVGKEDKAANFGVVRMKVPSCAFDSHFLAQIKFSQWQ